MKKNHYLALSVLCLLASVNVYGWGWFGGGNAARRENVKREMTQRIENLKNAAINMGNYGNQVGGQQHVEIFVDLKKEYVQYVVANRKDVEYVLDRDDRFDDYVDDAENILEDAIERVDNNLLASVMLARGYMDFDDLENLDDDCFDDLDSRRLRHVKPVWKHQPRPKPHVHHPPKPPHRPVVAPKPPHKPVVAPKPPHKGGPGKPDKHPGKRPDDRPDDRHDKRPDKRH